MTILFLFINKKDNRKIKCVLFLNVWQAIPLLQQVWSVSLFTGTVVSFLVFKTSMITVIKLFTFPLVVSLYRNIFLYSELRLIYLNFSLLSSQDIFLASFFSLFSVKINAQW